MTSSSVHTDSSYCRSSPVSSDPSIGPLSVHSSEKSERERLALSLYQAVQDGYYSRGYIDHEELGLSDLTDLEGSSGSEVSWLLLVN